MNKKQPFSVQAGAEGAGDTFGGPNEDNNYAVNKKHSQELMIRETNDFEMRDNAADLHHKQVAHRQSLPTPIIAADRSSH